MNNNRNYIFEEINDVLKLWICTLIIRVLLSSLLASVDCLDALLKLLVACRSCRNNHCE